MPTKRLFEIESRLDKVFCSTGKITDDEIKSHLSRYLCVLTSGYIEESFKYQIHTAIIFARFILFYYSCMDN